jgi:hypothetical protein
MDAIWGSTSKVPSGGTFTLTATVNSTKPVTGTVNIFQGTITGGGAELSLPLLLSKDKQSATVQAYLPAGTYPFFAQYYGDSNNLASESTTELLVVYTGAAASAYAGQTGSYMQQGVLNITLQ